MLLAEGAAAPVWCFCFLFLFFAIDIDAQDTFSEAVSFKRHESFIGGQVEAWERYMQIDAAWKKHCESAGKWEGDICCTAYLAPRTIRTRSFTIGSKLFAITLMPFIDEKDVFLPLLLK